MPGRACAAERVRPDAVATSPYPVGFFAHTYGLSSVQAVQEGWATPVLTYDRPLRLKIGTFGWWLGSGAPGPRRST